MWPSAGHHSAIVGRAGAGFFSSREEEEEEEGSRFERSGFNDMLLLYNDDATGFYSS